MIVTVVSMPEGTVTRADLPEARERLAVLCAALYMLHRARLWRRLHDDEGLEDGDGVEDEGGGPTGR